MGVTGTVVGKTLVKTIGKIEIFLDPSDGYFEAGLGRGGYLRRRTLADLEREVTKRAGQGRIRAMSVNRNSPGTIKERTLAGVRKATGRRYSGSGNLWLDEKGLEIERYTNLYALDVEVKAALEAIAARHREATAVANAIELEWRALVDNNLRRLDPDQALELFAEIGEPNPESATEQAADGG